MPNTRQGIDNVTTMTIMRIKTKVKDAKMAAHMQIAGGEQLPLIYHLYW